MMSIKNLIRRSFPDRWMTFRKAMIAYDYDMRRFLKHSVVSKKRTRIMLLSEIVKQYHIIEKGLVMPQTRLGFGYEVLNKLILNIIEFINKYGNQDIQLKHTIGVIYEYHHFHVENEFQLDKRLTERISKLRRIAGDVDATKQIASDPKTYFSKAKASFFDFSKSRSSIRNYTDAEVPIELIANAVDLSRNTPSVCNRQSWRVYLYSNKDRIKEILDLQGGNRGFGHLANKLIVITSELGTFVSLDERNQCFIDGGMFAMNLLYALHYNEIGACILNCSHSVAKDIKMRNATGVKDSESFIAMITLGHLPSKFQIASSKRYESDRILNVV